MTRPPPRSTPTAPPLPPTTLLLSHEMHTAPVDAGVRERGARGNDAIVDEVLAPLAPRMHADAEDGDVAMLTHAMCLDTAAPRPLGMNGMKGQIGRAHV